jgi:hypothetical protein
VPCLRDLAAVSLLAILVLPPGGAVEADPQPLPGNSGVATDVLKALMELRRGDGAALHALPDSAFTAPIALADPADADLLRRWTTALPTILDRLPAARRAGILDELDQAFRSCLLLAGPAADERRLASAFLPAPAAQRILVAEADLAFDRGRFQDYLGIHQLLAVFASAPPAGGDARAEVALALTGRGPEVDQSLVLPPPGAPLPWSTALSERPPRLAMRWAAVTGWLLACDPWNLPLWQYRVERSARILTGDGAALLDDGHGLRMVSDLGAVTALPPLPAGAHALAVSGGAAWFCAGSRGYRFDLASAAIASLDLGDEPICPPLVRGRQSLWLLPRDLLLFAGTTAVARLRHGLPVERGWRLSALGDQALIIALDGSLWRLESLAEQLSHATPAEQGRLLVAAGRYQEAIDRLAADAAALAPAGRTILLAAHLGLGPRHVADQVEGILALAQGVQDEVLIRQCAYLGALSSAPGHPADPALARTMATAVGRLAAAAPDALFSPCTLVAGTRSDFSEPPERWPHVLSGRGYRRAQEDLGASTPPPLDRDEPVAATPVPAGASSAPPEGEERRAADGSTVFRARVLRLSTGIGIKELRCCDRDGALLWRQRWEGLPVLVAPGTLVTCRGAAVFIIEGQRRVRVLDLFDGALLAEHTLADAELVGADFAALPAGRVVQLGPPGVNTRLEFLGLPRTPAVSLPAPARWLLALDGQAVVVLQDGRALSYPGGSAVRLPARLCALAQPPIALTAGLLAGDQLYPWRRR